MSDETACSECPKYVGKCPACHRLRPFLNGAKPSPAQARALKHYSDGEGAAESWDDELCGHGDTHLGFYRHERTIESLKRRGWVDASGITEAGRFALERASRE